MADWPFVYSFNNPFSALCQSSAVDLKTKEEKDAELDRRIEALRKKNEALVKRYQVGRTRVDSYRKCFSVSTPHLRDVVTDTKRLSFISFVHFFLENCPPIISSCLCF